MNKTLVYFYSAFVVLGILSFVLTQLLPTSPIGLTIIFFWLIFSAGFSMTRIFEISAGNFFDQVVLWVVIGLSFAFMVSLVAILLHLSILLLIWVYLTLIILAMIISFILEFRRSFEFYSLSIKDIFQKENILLLALIVFAIIMTAVMSRLGGNFDGDPAYHLSIMRKAIDNQYLSIGNLSYIKDHPLPAYAILIWPVFLAALAKITHLEIYNLWGQMPIILVPLVFLAWYALFQKIFKVKTFTILLVAIFVIFMFEGSGYLLTRLAVPDTLAKLVLTPMALWLSLKYIFNEKQNYKLLIISIIFLPLLALVHLTQYFYFYLIMGTFFVLFTIFRFKDSDYKTTLKKILLATFSNLALAVPIFGFMQIKTGLITGSYSTLSNRVADPELKVDTYTKFDIFTRYAYAFYPLTLAFVNRYRMLLIVLGSMMIAPVIFHTPAIYNIVNSLFSFVFIKRLFSNVTWYYAIWALAIGFIAVIIDRALTKTAGWLKSTLIGLIVILSVLIFFYRKVIYLSVFSQKANDILLHNFWWIVALLSIMAIGIFIWQLKQEKLRNFFEISEIKNFLPIFFLLISIIAVINFSAEKTIIENVKINSLVVPVRDYSAKAVAQKKVGGEDALAFIRENTPEQAIWESDLAYRDLPVAFNIHMAGWPNESLPEKEYSKVYEAEGDLATKLQCLKKGRAEYLLVSVKKDANTTVYQDYLTKIFENDIIKIYKIDQSKIAVDLGDSQLPEDLDCRARLYKK